MNTLNTRLIHTHDTAANWDLCTTFIPKAGELIVYDIDEVYTYERFKIGDGSTTVTNLPFTTEAIVKELFSIDATNTITLDAGRITRYNVTEEPKEEA